MKARVIIVAEQAKRAEDFRMTARSPSLYCRNDSSIQDVQLSPSPDHLKGVRVVVGSCNSTP